MQGFTCYLFQFSLAILFHSLFRCSRREEIQEEEEEEEEEECEEEDA
jgi:cbb3-type cytochrome oxidase subunit 3